MKNLISLALSFFINQYLINDVSPDSQIQCIKYYKMCNRYNYYININTIRIPDNRHNVSLSCRKVFNNSFSLSVITLYNMTCAYTLFLLKQSKIQSTWVRLLTLKMIHADFKVVNTRDSGTHLKRHQWLNRALWAWPGTAQGLGLDLVMRWGMGVPWLSSLCWCIPKAPLHRSKSTWVVVGLTFRLCSQTALGEGRGGPSHVSALAPL